MLNSNLKKKGPILAIPLHGFLILAISVHGFLILAISVHGFFDKNGQNFDPMILLHHLKELILSFQKNIKSLKLNTPNKRYGCSKDFQCIVPVYSTGQNQVCITRELLYRNLE